MQSATTNTASRYSLARCQPSPPRNALFKLSMVAHSKFVFYLIRYHLKLKSIPSLVNSQLIPNICRWETPKCDQSVLHNTRRTCLINTVRMSFFVSDTTINSGSPDSCQYRNIRVCISVCICTHTHTHTHACVCVCVYEYIFIKYYGRKYYIIKF